MSNFMMVGHGYGHYSMHGNSLLCILIMLVVLVDLILVGMWLWRKIKKEDIKLENKKNSQCTETCSCHNEAK